MNKEWSELNKLMQKQLNNKKSFDDGIGTLLLLRKKIMEQILDFRDSLTDEQMCAIPYMNAKGYHSKTIAYSIYHTFRIEDIVAHTIIKKDEEVLSLNDYVKRLNTPIITTGNELIKQQIADFSKQLNLAELFNYVLDVDQSTAKLLKEISYDDLKIQYTNKEKEAIRALHVVSDSDEAAWLIDYWCDKKLKGLIQMPFSRHWIMHVEASMRIRQKV